MDWDGILTEITDKLVTWDDLTPSMRKMMLFFYETNHPLWQYNCGLTRGTLEALKRRGLMEEGVDYTWRKPLASGYRVGLAYIELTAAGRRLVWKHLEQQMHKVA